MGKMKIDKPVYRAAGVIISIGLTAFLFLSYQTMYKQNHSIPILEYHHVTQDADQVGPWTVTSGDFDEQMGYLSQHFHVIPLRKLLDDLERGTPVPDHTAAITFDDGYLSNFVLVYPILQKYGIPATFFVVTGYVDGGGGGGYQSMTWDQLRVMTASGLADIQSHSHALHHRVYSQPDGDPVPAVLAHLVVDGRTETAGEYDERIEADLRQSRQDIMTQLGTDALILCWPYGAYDQYTNGLARRAGFVYMIGKTGYVNPSLDSGNITRIPVAGGISHQEFVNLVEPGQVGFGRAMVLEWGRIKGRLTYWRR